jgi:hypothetical protein
MDRPAESLNRLRERRRLVLLLRLDDQSLGIQLCERQAVRFRFRAVHRQQTLDPGGLSYVGALADHGYSTYSSLIEARRDTVERNPDLVQRFVNASAIGWYHYLFGDNAKANAAIKRANPGITDGQIAYSIAKLKECGIVDSGDALKLGIGAMTDARVKDFFDQMVKAGLVKPDTDYKKVYTLQFVDKGVGVGLGPSEQVHAGK